MAVKNMVSECGVELFGSGLASVAGSSGTTADVWIP
jgi:hypothetical protein